ncbi:MAG: hypothetical protein PHC61_01975 [Chitinivibrionales bacterium]|nr:hypothetical protein [Chitinivibrionales bacterium]
MFKLVSVNFTYLLMALVVVFCETGYAQPGAASARQTAAAVAIPDVYGRLDAAMIDIEARQAGLKNEINSLLIKLVRLRQDSLPRLQSEAAHIDSQIRISQVTGKALVLKRDQFRKDSLARELKASEEKSRMMLAIKNLDSLIAATAAEQKGLTEMQAKIKQADIESKAQTKQRLAALTNQKADHDSLALPLKKELAAIDAKREAEKTAAAAFRQKYEQLRAPTAAAAAAAETEYKNYGADRAALVAFQKEIKITLTIAKAKEELDAIMQEAAQGKRGARKRSEDKENEINGLDRQRSEYGSAPGVAARHAQFKGVPIEQTKVMVDSLVLAASADTQFTRLSQKAAVAQKTLAEFDVAHPAPAKKSALGLQLDSQYMAKEKALTLVVARSDSLGRAILSLQKASSESEAAAAAALARNEALLATLQKKSAELAARCAQAKNDSAGLETGTTELSLRIKNDRTKINDGLLAARRDSSTLVDRRQRTRQFIADMQEQIKRNGNFSQQEVRRLDSLIVIKTQLQQAAAQLKQNVARLDSLISFANKKMGPGKNEPGAVPEKRAPASSKPSAAAPVSAAPGSFDQAQKYLIQVYDYISKNRLQEALYLFNTQHAVLEVNLDRDVFNGVKSMVDEIAAGNKRKLER